MVLAGASWKQTWSGHSLCLQRPGPVTTRRASKKVNNSNTAANARELDLWWSRHVLIVLWWAIVIRLRGVGLAVCPEGRRGPTWVWIVSVSCGININDGSAALLRWAICRWSKRSGFTSSDPGVWRMDLPRQRKCSCHSWREGLYLKFSTLLMCFQRLWREISAESGFVRSFP